MQLVAEFGANDLEPVINTAAVAIGPVPYIVSCVPRGTDIYEPTEDTLSSAALKLKASEISGFSLHPTHGPIRYALVLEPYLGNPERSFYLGTIEYEGDDYVEFWKL